MSGPKVLLDTDAAVLLGDTALTPELFRELPIVMTPVCLDELGRLRFDGGDRYTERSARDAYFHYELRNNIQRVTTEGRSHDDVEEIIDDHELDDGEAGVIRKIAADDPDGWVVAANDADARAALVDAFERFDLSIYHGTPGLVVRSYVRKTGADPEEALSTVATAAKNGEGWNWDELEPEYRADAGIG